MGTICKYLFTANRALTTEKRNNSTYVWLSGPLNSLELYIGAPGEGNLKAAASKESPPRHG